MKRAKLINTVGLFMCIFLFLSCPSECENDDGDCYTPYGPCDEDPESTSTETQNQKKNQNKTTLKIIETEEIFAIQNKNFNL